MLRNWIAFGLLVLAPQLASAATFVKVSFWIDNGGRESVVFPGAPDPMVPYEGFKKRSIPIEEYAEVSVRDDRTLVIRLVKPNVVEVQDGELRYIVPWQYLEIELDPVKSAQIESILAAGPETIFFSYEPGTVDEAGLLAIARGSPMGRFAEAKKRAPSMWISSGEMGLPSIAINELRSRKRLKLWSDIRIGFWQVADVDYRELIVDVVPKASRSVHLQNLVAQDSMDWQYETVAESTESLIAANLKYDDFYKSLTAGSFFAAGTGVRRRVALIPPGAGLDDNVLNLVLGNARTCADAFKGK